MESSYAKHCAKSLIYFILLNIHPKIQFKDAIMVSIYRRDTERYERCQIGLFYEEKLAIHVTQTGHRTNGGSIGYTL